MAKLPSLSSRKLLAVLESLGFERIRQRGSHVFMRHPDGRSTVVADHPGEDVDRGLLNKIIRKDLGISRDEFLKHL